jgi:hypothetical protein
MQIGERGLLPTVRAAEPDTLVVADGFSCRQQIAHGTSRRALHTAEVLQRALHSSREPIPALRKDYSIEDEHTQPEPGLQGRPQLGEGEAGQRAPA